MLEIPCDTDDAPPAPKQKVL